MKDILEEAGVRTKGKGDVKKTGKVDPYAYIPLRKAQLNRRELFGVWVTFKVCIYASLFRDVVEKCIGEDNKYEGIRLLFDGLQQPLLNKQMSYVLLDIAVQELFPELCS
ncbi:hypothetical protein CRUP_012062 [Coryphaenoides rupestris]|nr:hypothetical protein CRUP_012062 [Coryphaenoides rupestris]